MVLKSALLATACSVRKSLHPLFLVVALAALGVLGLGVSGSGLLGLSWAQTNVLTYLELRDIGATPAEIILSPDFQTIIEFEGMTVESASSGRTDQITAQPDGETVRLRANQETVNTDLTVMVAGRTALFILRSDPTGNSPRRYVVRNSPPPVAAGLGYQGIEGRFDLNSLVGTNDLPPGVSLDLTARMDNKGDVTLYYTLSNDGEVAIVNEPSRLYILNEDITLKKTISRVPPAGSVNVIRPGNAESGVIVVPNPPNGQLTFAWVLVQLGPGGEYNAIVDVSALLAAPVGTTATVGTPTATVGTPASEVAPVPAEPFQAVPAPQPTEPASTTESAPATATMPAEGAPASPIPVDTALQSAGVTLYEHGDFTGASVLLAGAAGPISFYRADQGQFGAVADNRASSLVVPLGYSVLLCDLQATFPCEQYGSGSHTVKPELNDIFSFAQVSVLPIIESSSTSESVPTPVNLVTNGSFDVAEADPWNLWVNPDQGITARGSVTEGRYCVVMDSDAPDRNSVGLGQANLALEPTTTYTLSLDYFADRVASFAATYQKATEPWTDHFRQEIAADASNQHFEGSFTSTIADPEARLVFWFGANVAGTTICLDNIMLTATPAVIAEPAPAEPAPTAASERVFVEDTVPNSATVGGEEPWNWVSSNPAPFSGALAHQSVNSPALHQHFFENASEPLVVAADDSLFTYVYLDPTNPPTQIMLQWNVAGSWEHRAYWGANNIPAGQDGTPSLYRVGDLPAPGQWTRLEVPAAAVGLVDQPVTGMAFTLPDGQATWDKAGAVAASQSEPALAQTEQPVSSPVANIPDMAGSYTLAAAHSGLCADVPRFNQDNGAAIVQWNCNNEINQHWTLEPQGDYYTIVAEHSKKCLDVDSASTEEGHKVHQWECLGVDNQLWSLQQVTSGYQLVAKHSGKCLVVQDGSLEPGVVLTQWSCSGGEGATNDVFVLNVSEPGPDAPAATAEAAVDLASAPDPTTQPGTTGDNLVANASFDDSLSNAWVGDFFEGARGVAKVINSEYCFNSLNAGPFLNATRLIQFGLPLEAEQTYVLSFEAYADEARTINARVGQGYEPWTLHHSEYFTLQETKQIYTMTLKVPATPDPTSYLEFAMGGRMGSHPPFRVCFDNVSVKKAEVDTQASTPNVVGNPSFDDTVGSLWYGFFHAEGGSQGVSAISNGEFCMKVTNGGTEVWGVQLGQREFPLEANQTYTLSFEAYADQPHTIYTTVSQGYDPYGVFHKQDFAVSQEKQSYTTSFTMPAPGETNSGLEFWMGGDLATNPPFTMCFDNIVLKPGPATASQ